MTAEVDVKLKWPHEERDFTPWLAANLDKLSHVLGFILEWEGTEVSVGPYRADLTARLAQNGSLAVIENQLTHADPKHLGQLISYVARLKAKVGVWVATDFYYTNLCAVGSMNKCGRDSAHFFAVQLSLVESEGGAVQPVFAVKEHPKNWQDPVAQEFWGYFAEQCPNVPAPSFNPGSNLRRGRYYVSETDLQVVQHFEADFVRVYVTSGQKEPKSKAIARINTYRPKIIASLKGSGFFDIDDPYCTSRLNVITHCRRNWSHTVGWLNEQREIYEDLLRGGPSKKP